MGISPEMGWSLSENSIWLRAACFPPVCIRLYRR